MSSSSSSSSDTEDVNPTKIPKKKPSNSSCSSHILTDSNNKMLELLKDEDLTEKDKNESSTPVKGILKTKSSKKTKHKKSPDAELQFSPAGSLSLIEGSCKTNSSMESNMEIKDKKKEHVNEAQGSSDDEKSKEKESLRKNDLDPKHKKKQENIKDKISHCSTEKDTDKVTAKQDIRKLKKKQKDTSADDELVSSKGSQTNSKHFSEYESESDESCAKESVLNKKHLKDKDNNSADKSSIAGQSGIHSKGSTY